VRDNERKFSECSYTPTTLRERVTFMIQEARRSFLRFFTAAGVFGVAGGVAGAQGGEPGESAGKRRVVSGASSFFSRAVEYGRLVFVSGVLGREDQKGVLASPDFEPQCRQALANLKGSVEAAGSSLEKMLKCTCFLTDAADFAAFNRVYKEFFPADPPARSTVVVKELVLAGAKIEIDCVTHV